MKRSGWLGLALVVCALAVSAVWAVPEDTPPPSGWLGVRLDNSANGADGVAVAFIIEDSPAHRAGLRARDLILAVDGQPVHSAPELIQAVQGQDPGAWVSLSVERRGEPWDLRLRLDERPTDLRQTRTLVGWIGVESIDLPPALREHFGAPKQMGVMISGIVEGSPAESAGLELGDVVFEVDGRHVMSPGQLEALLAGSGIGNDVELRLARSGLEMVVEAVVQVKPEPAPAGD